MQFERRMAIRKQWGDKQCGHPFIEKEYMQGSQTGDYICTQCGREVEPAECKSESKDD